MFGVYVLVYVVYVVDMCWCIEFDVGVGVVVGFV